MPPHRLALKEGMPLLLLRNLNPREGLCNGTRLVLKDIINGCLLKAVIANGSFSGREVFIPRITLQPSDDSYPFQWRRRQFPVRVAFAMTINKSQGRLYHGYAFGYRSQSLLTDSCMLPHPVSATLATSALPSNRPQVFPRQRPEMWSSKRSLLSKLTETVT